MTDIVSRIDMQKYVAIHMTNAKIHDEHELAALEVIYAALGGLTKRTAMRVLIAAIKTVEGMDGAP